MRQGVGMRSAWSAGLLLLGLLVAFRALGAAFTEQLPNFNPLLALFLCSIACVRGPVAWGLPLAAWILSNPLASWLQGYAPFGEWGPVLTALLSLAVIGAAAVLLRRRPSAPVLLGSSVLAAVLFHAVTGVAAWITYPPYAPGAEGLWQALWSGPPGATLPSWAFLRNLAAANLAFTALFLLARHSWLPRPAACPVVPTTR